jgi:hypothetical protein
MSRLQVTPTPLWLSLSTAVAVAACGSLSPSTEQDPCVQLGQICDGCKLPADQENCQNAIATADDAQCAAVLDQSGFLADCTPRDGGADAAKDAEAGVPPACGMQASEDAGCSCTGTCAPSCPGGGCAFTCLSGTCSPTCAGGHCTLVCEQGATCESDCSGGNCIIDCQGGSQCANTCSGGGCTFQCQDNSICTDTCGSATTCTGM